MTLIVPSPFENRQGNLRRPTRRERQRLEEIYGAPIIIDGFDYAKKPRHIRGLAVHLVENRQGLRDYRGDVNLFDGRSQLYRELLDDKWREYEVISRIDRNIMPKTILAAHLMKNSTAFRQAQKNLRQALEARCNVGAAAERLLQIFFRQVNRRFPKGAFIKYIREYRTCEADQLTYTPHADAQNLAAVFSKHIGRPKSWIKAVKESKIAAVHIVGFLLSDPSQIMVQQKLNIAKTRDGTLAEVRVDFGSKGPIIANVRWGYDFEWEYNQKAFQFFQSFWERWPPELQRQFGGADVVFLKNGGMKIIEFNFGSESGFMDAAQLIIPGNLFVSQILGRPTALIAHLEKLVAMPTSDQIRELSKLIPRTKRDDETHLSLRDLHLGDVWIYLRDRLVENWMKRPTPAGARRLSVRLQTLAKSQIHRIEDERTKQLILDMARFGTEAMLDFLNKERKKKLLQENSWFQPAPKPSANISYAN